ncbi:MAG: DUF11 domain-containing protein [Anaerolineales bacterium]|nr:DUF11 domain-containing protein [Anaerolineales bacterium]
MRRNKWFVLVFCLVALVGMFALVAPTMAAAITLTNNTAGVADASWLSRTVTVNSGDLPLGAIISTVRIAIDFDKIDAPASNCDVGHQGGSPYNSDMVFYLTSPAGTKVVLVESYSNWGGSGGACTSNCATYSDENSYNGPYEIIFDDAATLAAGPTPNSGTFQPVQPLAAFEGESPFGTWTLSVGDDDSLDPVCFTGFSLELNTPGEITDLVLDKTGPATVVAGEAITYTVVVTNTGPSVAPLIEIIDNLPDEVAAVNAFLARSGSGSSGECAYAVCQAANVSVGEVLTMTLTGFVDPGVVEDAILINHATAFASGDLEPNSSDSTTTTIQAEADLSLDKVALANTVAPGEGLLYQIAVANDGPSDAQGVRVVDTLDPNATFAAASPGCNYDSNTHQVTCDLGQMAADSTAHILLAVVVGQVPGGTVLTNHGAVSSDTSDPATGNNTDIETTDIVQESEPSANLVIAKVAEPAAVEVGGLITYQLTITNTGPQTATNIEVLELLPNGTTVVNLAADNPDFAHEFCTQGGICYLGSMDPGTTALVTATLRIDVNLLADTLTNVAAVTADEPDSEPDNNLAHATVTLMPMEYTFFYLPLYVSVTITDALHSSLTSPWVNPPCFVASSCCSSGTIPQDGHKKK